MYLGTSVAPKPTDIAAVRMKRFLRVNGHVEMIRIPEIATAEKRNVVMPPSTGLGIATRAAANLLKMPITSNQKQQQ
jgi:hypothetical protein